MRVSEGVPTSYSGSLRIADMLVILLVFSAALFLVLAGNGAYAGQTAVVKQNGSLYSEIQLARNGITEINGLKGAIKLEVLNGSIHVADSACPKGLCRHWGWINGPGEAIVCVPNKLTIEIKNGHEGRFDAVTY
ncbi:MAG: NusG domain II-containing protein [Elusimicrobia bacterium]|nr:NusG domain II-containing protein [Candidatus Liberimonas magnetica]